MVVVRRCDMVAEVGRSVGLVGAGGGGGWMCQSAGLRRNERKARLRSATAWHRRLRDERESCALSTHPRRYIQPPAHAAALRSGPYYARGDAYYRGERRVRADTGCAPLEPPDPPRSRSKFFRQRASTLLDEWRDERVTRFVWGGFRRQFQRSGGFLNCLEDALWWISMLVVNERGRWDKGEIFYFADSEG